MAAAKEVKLSMRVWIDKERKKVLFAEVDRHVADILISFLTLPLGTIVRILNKHYGEGAPDIGSLNILYNSLQNLDNINFWTKYTKPKLLNAENMFGAYLHKLKINVDDTEPIKYFACENLSRCKYQDPIRVSVCSGAMKCGCGSFLKKELNSSFIKKVGREVFTRDTASFILTDDLRMMPNWVQSALQILNNLGVNTTNKVEEQTVVVGHQEVMDLLKGSLISKTPLSDLVFPKKHMVPLTEIYEFSSLISNNAATSKANNISVKLIVQKSTGKIMLAQTTGGFVDFLFSFLTIPLGGVLSLLGGDSFVGSIHNLYGSLTSLKSDDYMKTLNLFKKPCVPFTYLSKYQLLPVTEESGPQYCYSDKGEYILSTKKPSANVTSCSVLFCDPNDQGRHVKGHAMFSVTDDLDVKPTYATSGFSILNSLKVPINDMEENVIDIGMKEALSILKASLYSKSALNNGLKNLLMRRPKEEKM